MGNIIVFFFFILPTLIVSLTLFTDDINYNYVFIDLFNLKKYLFDN